MNELRSIYYPNGQLAGWSSCGPYKLHLFKAIRSNRKIKNGQKLWAVDIDTGANGTWTVCKYRGTGSWCRPFVHWEWSADTHRTLSGGIPEVKYLGEVLVPQRFFEFIEIFTDHS